MHVRSLIASGVVVGAFGLVLATSAPALAACDAYSGNCTTPPATKSPDGDGGGDSSTSTKKPSTLPFTGGELVLLSAIGAGALAGGTDLVIAGRRRSATDS